MHDSYFAPVAKILGLALALCLGGCTRFDVLNATIPSCGYALTQGVPYGDQPREQLDIYIPHHVKPHAPIVVFFYGGDWQNGARADYRFVAQALTSRGFIAVLPDYRLYPQVTFPTFVYDGARAVAWVHAHIGLYGGDSDHLYLAGHSAGAHIATLLTLDGRYLASAGVDKRIIRGTIGLAGPYDFNPSTDDRAVFGLRPGQPPGFDMEPISFADGQSAPLLLIQGTGDETVEPSNAVRLADQIHQARGAVRLQLYPGVGHVPLVLSFAWPFRWLTPALNDLATFISSCEMSPPTKKALR